MAGRLQVITITHPRTGNTKSIDAEIYSLIRAAILKSLKKSKGKTFTELADDVTSIIRAGKSKFTGSIPWYTISVRLDLEARGVIETFMQKGKKFARLNH
jgi:hypothetical protein